MSQLQFQIFKTVEDRYNWDKYIEYVEKTEDIENDQKEKLKSAYLTLKAELGKGFLKNTRGKNHIISSYVLRSDDESYNWVIWFAENLNCFKQLKCNYDELLSKLISVNKSRVEGIPFLEIADCYRKSGFEIVFEPFKNSKQKNPDIKIVNPENNETFFIEISKLNDSDDRINKRNTFYEVFGEFIINPYIPFAGKILRKLKTNELKELIEKIKEVKCLSSHENSFKAFCDDRIDFAIAPFENIKELKNWCETKRYEIDRIISLELNINETKRIIGNKLPDKAPQIPNGKFGIICIPVNPLYLYFHNPYENIREIEQKLNTYENILGLCLYSLMGAESQNKGCLYKMHYIGNKTVYNTVRKDTLFIFNNKCKIPVFPNTIEKIYSTFDN